MSVQSGMGKAKGFRKKRVRSRPGMDSKPLRAKGRDTSARKRYPDKKSLRDISGHPVGERHFRRVRNDRSQHRDGLVADHIRQVGKSRYGIIVTAFVPGKFVAEALNPIRRHRTGLRTVFSVKSIPL